MALILVDKKLFCRSDSGKIFMISKNALEGEFSVDVPTMGMEIPNAHLLPVEFGVIISEMPGEAPLLMEAIPAGEHFYYELLIPQRRNFQMTVQNLDMAGYWRLRNGHKLFVVASGDFAWRSHNKFTIFPGEDQYLYWDRDGKCKDQPQFDLMEKISAVRAPLLPDPKLVIPLPVEV